MAYHMKAFSVTRGSNISSIKFIGYGISSVNTKFSSESIP